MNVTYLGAHIDQSPYEVSTYSPKLVHLSKMPLGILGIPFKFRGKSNTSYLRKRVCFSDVSGVLSGKSG